MCSDSSFHLFISPKGSSRPQSYRHSQRHQPLENLVQLSNAFCGVLKAGTDYDGCLGRAASDRSGTAQDVQLPAKTNHGAAKPQARASVYGDILICVLCLCHVLLENWGGRCGPALQLAYTKRVCTVLSRHATAGAPPFPPGDVFFVETSEQTDPSYLFTCSVESAARAHPGTKVVVLMKGLAKGNASLPNHWAFSLLSCFPNVEIRPLDLPELFAGTPLAKWYLQPYHCWEPFLPVLSDACRITIMWKFGGIYLDTDFIVLKNLKNLTNALGKQSQDVLNGAFLSFKPKHEFMELCMQDFVDNYNGLIWAHQGPELLTRVFKRWCSISNIENNMNCKGVRALSPEAVYPIHWEDWKKLFEPISSSELHKILKDTYAVHVWNKLSHGTKLEITSQAFLAQLYSQFCPATYAKMKKDSEEQSRPAM